MAEYAMLIGKNAGVTAGGAVEWASTNEIFIFIGASAFILFVLYKIFLNK